MIVLTIVFFCLTVRNSVGNVAEITQLLDKDNYTQTQIEENYKMLIEKWGEWEIIGENNSGLVVRYVDIRAALFSGLMITYAILTCVFFAIAIILGKILFPKIAKMYLANNDEMVNLATLKSAQQIEDLTNAHKTNKEWF